MIKDDEPLPIKIVAWTLLALLVFTLFKMYKKTEPLEVKNFSVNDEIHRIVRGYISTQEIKKFNVGQSEFQKSEEEKNKNKVAINPNREVIAKELDRQEKEDELWEIKRNYVKWVSKLWGVSDKWAIIEAVWQMESGKTLYTDIQSSAGAQGPMQFMPITWEAYKIDGNMDGIYDINDYEDAVQSGIHYLIASGLKEDEYQALYNYNHSTDYVSSVLNMADKIKNQ